MKRICYFFCILSLFTVSCTDLTPLEDEIEQLKEEISNLQSVISLQQAFSDQKIIVSVTSATIETADYWILTFADNSTVQLPEAVVESIDLNGTTQEYTVKLLNDQQLVFNRKEIIYPTGLVILTDDIKFLRNTEVSIEFRVNPSNAVFNYNVNSSDCQITFDMADKILTYSYDTNPERCRLTRIEQSRDANGKVKEGQYTAYIKDIGWTIQYIYKTALVLSTKDKNGDPVQLSSSTITLERKKDTRLPIVVIHTENKAEIRDKEHWINAKMTIDGIDIFPDYEGDISIRGRGNATWTYPKRPYNIRLNSRSEILGMPSNRRWRLIANYMDRTLIRNHIAFEISRRTGLEWTVRGQFVEVMLNDVHYGNYYLTEHINIDPNRVNITEMNSNDIDEESITGGYILEYDIYFDEVNKFRSKIWNFPVNISEPGSDVLKPAQFEYIQNYIDSLEYLLSDELIRTREYASMIADTTFIDYWFVMELTGNSEPRVPASCFFYKDRMDVLKAGPVWDFDFGTLTTGKVSGFYVKDALYYAQLFKDPVFVSKVRERWRRFKPAFEEVTEIILETGSSLSVSAELDDAMWSLLNFNTRNEDEKLAYMDAIRRISSNYNQRLNWLDQQITNLR